jgi:hypothetical protein
MLKPNTFCKLDRQIIFHNQKTKIIKKCFTTDHFLQKKFIIIFEIDPLNTFGVLLVGSFFFLFHK